MKTLRFVVVQLFLCHIAFMCAAQQNLVNNPSFEDKIQCPNNADQVERCANWRSYAVNSTPDYYNSCHSGNYGVPNNTNGNQPAASGNAYCGVLAHHQLTTTHFEYIAGTMTPLVPGNTYEVSISVNLSNNSSYTTDNIGVLLYDAGVDTITTSTILPTPQIYYDSYGLITDKQNWVRLKKTFIADSAYDNIIIGAFSNSNNSYGFNKINNNGFAAYYYIDSVVVKLTDYIKVTSYDTLLCAGDTVSVGYILDPVLNSNNVFTLQLSDKNGSFASPVAIGTKNDSSSGIITGVIPNTVSNGTGYRMRMVASSPADTSDTTAIAIKIGNIDSSNVAITASSSILCAGSSLNFSASTSVASAAYEWNGPNSFTSSIASPSFASVTTAMSGNYYATVRFYGCEVLDTFSVTVNPTPFKPLAGSNSPVCIGDTLKLTANSSNGATYIWTGPNNFNSPFQNPNRYNLVWNDTGAYTVIAKLGNCTSPAGTINVTANVEPFVVIYPTNDSICVGEAVTFTALPNNAGGTPTYKWYVNGLQAAASGTTFTTSTLQHNDVVSTNMTEYTKCGKPYTDPSNDVQMTVLQYVTPSVSITASPGGTLPPGQLITFTATPVNGGVNPGYQWMRNGNDVIGATGMIWGADNLNDNDSISVVLISDHLCAQPKTVESNGIIVDIFPVNIGEIAKEGLLNIYPNPNSGSFTLEGDVASGNEWYDISITNAIGQVVYRTRTSVTNGKLHHTINMRAIAQGIYILKLSANNGSYTVISFRVN